MTAFYLLQHATLLIYLPDQTVIRELNTAKEQSLMPLHGCNLMQCKRSTSELVALNAY